MVLGFLFIKKITIIIIVTAVKLSKERKGTHKKEKRR